MSVKKPVRPLTADDRARMACESIIKASESVGPLFNMMKPETKFHFNKAVEHARQSKMLARKEIVFPLVKESA